MDSKNYILNHDFGYGKGDLTCALNKLELRTLEDVKFYVNWSMKEIFVANVTNNNIITFYDDNSKTQILIEKVEG